MAELNLLKRYGRTIDEMVQSLEASAAQYDRWEAENMGSHVKGAFAKQAAEYRADAAEWRAAQAPSQQDTQ